MKETLLTSVLYQTETRGMEGAEVLPVSAHHESENTAEHMERNKETPLEVSRGRRPRTGQVVPVSPSLRPQWAGACDQPSDAF